MAAPTGVRPNHSAEVAVYLRIGQIRYHLRRLPCARNVARNTHSTIGCSHIRVCWPLIANDVTPVSANSEMECINASVTDNSRGSVRAIYYSRTPRISRGSEWMNAVISTSILICDIYCCTKNSR